MNRQQKGLALILMGILCAVVEIELDTEILHLCGLALGGVGIYFIFSRENGDGGKDEKEGKDA